MNFTIKPTVLLFGNVVIVTWCKQPYAM